MAGDCSDGDCNVSANFVINSPAVAFLILYSITLLIFAAKALAEPTSVVLFLVLFGAIRVAELGMEVVIDDPNLGTPQISVASGALWDAGMFALLYSAHMLVLERGTISGNVVSNRVTRITSNPRLFRLILAIGVVLGISANACAFPALNNNDDSGDLGDISWNLQLVCEIIFLFASLLLAVQTAFLLSAERTRSSDQESTPGERSEAAYTKYIPSLIAVLLLFYGIYQTVAINTFQSNVEGYLLTDLPEWLAVALFAVKGLIPPRKSVVPSAPDSECGKESMLAPVEDGSGVHESPSG